MDDINIDPGLFAIIACLAGFALCDIYKYVFNRSERQTEAQSHFEHVAITVSPMMERIASDQSDCHASLLTSNTP